MTRLIHITAAAFFCGAPLLSALWPYWVYLLALLLIGVIVELLGLMLEFALGID